MTRKHFIAIAEVLNSTEASNETIEEMAWVCAKFNPHFNKDTFLSAAGYRNNNKENK